MDGEVEYVYTVGKRVDSRLVYTTSDEQLFVKYRDSKGGVHYNCYKKKTNGCTANIFLQNGVCKRTKNFEIHNHSNQREEYKQFKLEESMKLKSQSDPCIAIRNIVSEHSAIATESPDSPFRKFKSTLYYNRHKTTPLNPTTIVEAVTYFDDEKVKILLSKSFNGKQVYHQVTSTEDTRYAVITATMRVVPSSSAFKVAVTFSVIKSNEAFPCIFAFLTNRDQQVYELIIHKIQEKWNLNLSKAWIDYEKSLREAVRKEYPDIEMKSFWFQYYLAVRRKCKTIPNFFEYLWENPIANVLYHKYLCLALLPSTEIAAGLDFLKDQSVDLDIFNKVIDYFEKMWMWREGPSNFTIEREYFGKQVSVNYNSLLRKKFHLPESRFSFLELITLTQAELIKSSNRYQLHETNCNAEIPSRQSNFIKKQYDSIVKSDTKDIPHFFATLTYKDNNGAVTEMDNYIIGDENDFEENDDDDYENVLLEQQAQNAQEQPEQQPQTQACVVCLSNSITTMLEPCNHLKFCRDCVDTLMVPRLNEYGEEITPSCPVCRGVIRGTRFVYF